MELCDDNLFKKREKDLSDGEYYDESFIIKILKQICEGLSYLHGKKIAHRDIDPRNIMIKDGVIKLIDFGFSDR